MGLTQLTYALLLELLMAMFGKSDFFSASELFNKQPGFLWERREGKEIPRTVFEEEIVVVCVKHFWKSGFCW